jgi:hypothetical protein
VSDYFHFIDKKDMQKLLNLFAEDCIIFEPFSKKQSLHFDNGNDKTCLKGKFEIESFFNVVMMASDGLQYQIEFMDKPIVMDCEQTSKMLDYSSSSIVSVLATFYGIKEGFSLKEKLTFHIVSRKKYESINTQDNDSNFNRNEIRILWIQFCSLESTN